MGHLHPSRRARAVAWATCLALLPAALATGCAPPADQLPSTGSSLRPTFAAEPHPTGRPKARKNRTSPDAMGAVGPGTKRDRTSSPSPRPSVPAGTAPSTGSTDGASTGPGSATAAASDPTGDLSGSGPAYVDLVAATLTRRGDRFTLAVEAAGTFPAKGDDDHVADVVGFVDTDLDGQVDYEVWATLTDEGWTPSWRHPDGARFGADSGVTVSTSGRTLTLSFGADRLGGAHRFQWSTGAEHGTYEQVTLGTTAQDHAPDDGAVGFPG